MKVNIIKPHPNYSGEVDLSDEAANYLIRMGVAEVLKEKPEVKHTSKVEHKETKEKAEKSKKK